MKNFIQSSSRAGKIFRYTLTSPIGDIEIASCRGGLHSVKQCDADDSTFSPDEKIPVSLKSGQQDGGIAECEPASSCYLWLKNYFMQGIASTAIPPLCSSVVKQDSFCAKALQVLPEAAPMGKTVTYKELAQLCGNVQACRAAGHAMATNPVSLLIPCHRVVTTNSGPGNYSHGKKNNIKLWLLDFEKRSQIEGV